MSCSQYTNLSGYKFVTLSHLTEIKALLLNLCKKNHIKGTILVAPEGININLSGADDHIKALLDSFAEISWLEGLSLKKTFSDYVPFNRMLVRLKKEIIAFDQKGIDPKSNPAPYIEPEELKKWYDQNKDFIILDTRNDYEVKIGTFKNALNPDLKTFKKFTETLQSLPPEARELPVVTFCTGGVRCEKAAPFLKKEGFKKDGFSSDGAKPEGFRKNRPDRSDGTPAAAAERPARRPREDSSEPGTAPAGAPGEKRFTPKPKAKKRGGPKVRMDKDKGKRRTPNKKP
jgi:predicted sulfurtransferase